MSSFPLLRRLCWPGPHAKKSGISKSFLLEDKPQKTDRLQTVLVGLLLELDEFCQQKSYKGSQLLSWLQLICQSSHLQDVTISKLHCLVKSLREKVKDVRGTRDKTAEKDLLEQACSLTPALSASVLPRPPQDTSSIQPFSSTSVGIQVHLPWHDMPDSKREQKAAPEENRELQVKQAQVEALTEVVIVIREMYIMFFHMICS